MLAGGGEAGGDVATLKNLKQDSGMVQSHFIKGRTGLGGMNAREGEPVAERLPKPLKQEHTHRV